jgi:hypothetical protein
LRKVEQLLEKGAPQHRHRWASLLNALLVHAEGPSQGRHLYLLKESLLDLVSVDDQRLLYRAIDALVTAARFDIVEGDIKVVREDGAVVNHSFTENTIDFVAFLRYDLGLSVLHVYRYLKDYQGAPTPPAALYACIGRVRPRAG